MISRRRFLAFGVLAALPARVGAQGRAARIGILGPTPLETSVYANAVMQAFTQLGYAEGARASFRYRFAEGHLDLFRRQAQEVVKVECDLVIGIRVESATRALQLAKPAGPILFLAIDYDPVESGVVSSLRRPDRNTTGVYVPQNVLIARRVALIRELLPQASRLMVFADPYSADQVEAARKAAAAANFQLVLVQFVTQPYDYATYLQPRRGVGADAFMNLASPVFAQDRQQIHEALYRLGIPAMGSNTLQAEAGFLLALGSSIPKVGRRVADMGVRLLAGTKPSAMPVELADEFELVVNSRTAKALGIKLAESVLARATRVIE